MSFPILPHDETDVVDKTSAFNNLILMGFPQRECRDRNYLYMLKFVGVQEPVAKTLNYLLQV